MMSRKIVKLLVASVTALFLGLTCDDARAAAIPMAKAQSQAVEKKTAVAKKPARARKRARQSLTIVTKAPNDAPDFDYQDRIQEAQELVAKQPVLPGDMQFDRRGKLTHFVWTLVVGQKTGPLTVIRMDEKGRNDQGFSVTWAVDNFINTHFRITKPEGYIVFAQRRPVRSGNGYVEGVYTAYSPEMDTKTMRGAGLDYLRHLQRLAYQRIKDHDVRSRVSPNLTVAEKIPTGTVVRLMITEHIDPGRMKYVGIEQCVHEVLFTIAANRSHAYAYSKSSAGARGLAQFIEPSYHMVRDNYPKALLEPNFERGMRDLNNGVLASVLLLDLELTHLPRSYLNQVTDSSQELAAFLAAGYNRNPARVVKTYHRTKSFTGGNAPYQNKMYVRIQSWIGGFLKKEYDIT